VRHLCVSGLQGVGCLPGACERTAAGRAKGKARIDGPRAAGKCCRHRKVGAERRWMSCSYDESSPAGAAVVPQAMLRCSITRSIGGRRHRPMPYRHAGSSPLCRNGSHHPPILHKWIFPLNAQLSLIFTSLFLTSTSNFDMYGLQFISHAPLNTIRLESGGSQAASPRYPPRFRWIWNNRNHSVLGQHSESETGRSPAGPPPPIRYPKPHHFRNSASPRLAQSMAGSLPQMSGGMGIHAFGRV
jgi:hypothetical protein